MNTRWIILAALMIIAIGGCGSDDEPSAASGNEDGSLSKAEFVKQAGDICEQQRRNVLKELGAFYKKHNTSPAAGLTAKSLPEKLLLAKAFKAVYLPMVEAEVDAIRKLGAPEGDEAKIDAILAAERRGIHEARKMKQAKENTDFTHYFSEAGPMLRDYGITRCVKG